MSKTDGYNRTLVIGKAPYYVKIGTAYLATMEKPTEEQQARIKTDYGFEFVDAGDVPQ